MRYIQYKGVVEREYKMSLKKVMHQLCITENLSSVEGAKRLGIAKEIFVYWRRYFRMEERQLLFDQTVNELMNRKNTYSGDIKNGDLQVVDAPSPSSDLEEFEIVVDELIEYYKYIHYSSEGLALETAKLPFYKFSKTLIVDYKNGELSKEMKAEAKELI